MDYDQAAMSMEEWARDKPLSILQLDPADRAVLRIADERDAIQKKTFTKWVNKHLTKCGKRVSDLFEDLRDGHNLVSLVEVLSGEHLPRERGRMRFHMLQNVENVLRFLRYRKIKLVNIRAEDIVDGNPKLTLGLIWTIILHFQISDIVVGMEENVSAKDVLLKWAQKTTAKYPGVRVDNFTTSWKDGLAFNAIIHRNRPDLIDWRSVQRRSARDRLETAFSVAERDCGVTRLLDAEDVDTPQPDEKSLITYISSLYDAFPEPPRLHPLYDTDSQKKWEEYREIASSLYTWTRQNVAIMQDRHFPTSLIDLRKMAADMNRFRVEEVPPRAHEKQRIAHLFRDVEKHFRDNDMDRELHMESIDRNWQTLMLSHQEKDQAIHDEIKKLEKLQRVAEKLHRDAKHVEIKLDEVEQRIDEEARRIDRLHPLDAKHNCDQLEREMQLMEDTIKSMFTDAQALRDARYHQAPELHKMVQHLHQRWINVRTLLHNRLLSVLASISFPIEERTVTRMSKTVLETRLVETNQHFRFVQECSDWIKSKQKRLQDADYGSDLPSVQAELEKQLSEHKTVEKFQSSIEKCSAAKISFHGEELQLYITYLNTVQKSFTDLLMSSKKRQSDLETLMDFVQSATNELIWLSEKEEREITRDWSSKNLNLVEVEQYYEALMSELERREIQFNAVQDRGESLVLQHHPASKCIETYMSAMQTQWSWLLQLTLCLETHLKYVATYQQYFSDVRECEQQIARKEDLLNSVFSKADFNLDEGEVLLKDMQDMRDELTKYGDFIQGLTNQSRDIIPLKQRKTNVTRPITVTAICNYKQNNQQMTVSKDERCILHDNSQRVRWRVTNSSGLEGMVPGVCFLIPPPDKEALEAVERIRRQYDRAVSLWQKKQLKMRQNMIFATIKVVKSWDLTQFLAMGAEQRNAIRRALNEDAEKLILEGDPTDPALRRLRREIDDVNRLFDEFERKAIDAERTKHASKSFVEQVQSLQSDLDEYEKTLVSRVNAPIPRDIETLQRQVVEHKEFERNVQILESRVRSVQSSYSSLTQKSSTMQSKVERISEKWEKIVSISSVYVERLKTIESVLSNLEETSNYVSNVELKLTSHDTIPKDEESVKKVTDELFSFQNSLQVHQSSVDRLIEDTRNVRRVVEKSRSNSKRNPDVDRLEEDVNRTTSRWSNVCTEVVERIKTSSTAYDYASKYNTSYRNEMNWLESVDTKSKTLPLVEGGSAKRKLHPHMTLYNSVIEEKITIEQVNTMGARLAKEAKTYDTNLDKYRLRIEEDHPSLDGSLVKKAKVQSTDEAVLLELDQMNLKYQLVADNLYEKIQQITDAAKQEDPTFEISTPVPAPSRLRTYRTHLSLRDLTSPATDLGDSQEGDVVDYIQQKSTAKVSLTPASLPSPKKLSVTPIKNGNHAPNEDIDMQNSEKPPISSLHFAQIRSAKRIERVEEGISTETATQVPVVIDPQTGDALTLAQAIGCGLIDIKTGSFVDPRTGKHLTLQEAAEQGYIDPSVVHKLLGLCGLVDPHTGKDLTLLDAIKLGWYDLSKGGNFVDPQTGEPISPEQAIRIGIATREKVSPVEASSSNLVSRTLCTSFTSVLSSELALPYCSPCLVELVNDSSSTVVDVESGSVTSVHVEGASNRSVESIEGSSIAGIEFNRKGSSLSDLLDQELVSVNTSAYPRESIRIVDRFSAVPVSFHEAHEKGVLDTSKREVFHPAKSSRVSVKFALENNLIDESTGLWDSQVLINDARKINMIMKPLSLRDCHTMNLLVPCPTQDNLQAFKVIEPATTEMLSIADAVTKGLLDTEQKTVLHVAEAKFVTLPEALEAGIITPDGNFKDTKSEEQIPLDTAAQKGYLSSFRRMSIFELPCIIDFENQQLANIYDASKRGIIDVETQKIKIQDGTFVTLQDPNAAAAFVPPLSQPLLQNSGLHKSTSSTEKGKKRKQKEISVLEAIVHQIVLPTGEVLDFHSKIYCPINSAVVNKSLEPRKADLLKSLYDINVIYISSQHPTTVCNVRSIAKYSLPASFSIPDMPNFQSQGSTQTLQSVVTTQSIQPREEVVVSAPLADTIIEISLKNASLAIPATDNLNVVEITGKGDVTEISKQVTQKVSLPSTLTESRVEKSSTPSTKVEITSPRKSKIQSKPETIEVLVQPPIETSVNRDKKITSIDLPKINTSLEPGRSVTAIESDNAETLFKRRIEEDLDATLDEHPLTQASKERIVTTETYIKETKLGIENPLNLADSQSKMEPAEQIVSKEVSSYKSLYSRTSVVEKTVITPADLSSALTANTSPSSAKVVNIPVGMDQTLPISSNLGTESIDITLYQEVKTDSDKSIDSSSDSKTITITNDNQVADKSVIELPTAPKTTNVTPTPLSELSAPSISGDSVSPVLETLIKDPSLDILSKFINIPTNGWSLENTINEGLMDTEQGLLTIPGTDRLVSFQECIHLAIIDETSAEVVEPLRTRKFSLAKALEKQIISPTGQYHTGVEVLCLKDAIYQGYVSYVAEEIETSAPVKPARSTETSARECEKVQATAVVSKDAVAEAKRHEFKSHMPVDTTVDVEKLPERESPSPVNQADSIQILEAEEQGTADIAPESTIVKVIVGDNLMFDSSTAEVLDTETNTKLDLLTAVMQGKVKPTLVKIQDPVTGKVMNINEAIRKGKVNKKTGKIMSGPNQEISFKEALALGMLCVFAKPMELISCLIQKEGEEIEEMSSTVAIQHQDTSHYTQKGDFKEDGEIIIITEEIIPIESVVTSTTTITTTTVITTQISRVRVDSNSLVQSGLVDAATAEKLSKRENYEGPSGEPLTLKEALALGKIDGDSGAILEFQTQQLLTINEALTRNVIDNDGKFLLPVARSLSVPELKTQGLFDPEQEKVIHPFSGDPLTISEAIASDVLNPLSPVQDPVTKTNVPLSVAVEKRVICDNTGKILDPAGNISLVDAIESGLYKDCKHPLEGNLPPVALTVPAAMKRGLFNEETKVFVNPVTKEEISYETALEEGLLTIDSQRKDATPVTRTVSGDNERSKYTRTEENPESANGKAIDGTSAISLVAAVVSAAIRSHEPIEIVSSVEQNKQGRVNQEQVVTEKSEAVSESKLEQMIAKPTPHPLNIGDSSGVVQTTLSNVILTKDSKKKHKEIKGPKITVKSETVKLIPSGTPENSDVITTAGSKPPVNKPEDELCEEPRETLLEVQITSMARQDSDKLQASPDMVSRTLTQEILKSVPMPRLDANSKDFSVKDPRTGIVLKFEEAVSAGLILYGKGVVVDPVSGSEISLEEAISTGLLVPSNQSLSIPEVIYSNQYDPVTATVTDKEGEKIPLKIALENGIVNDQTCVVKHFATENIIPFKSAVLEGIVDLDAGSLQTADYATINLDEALDAGWLVEAVTPLSLSELILKGIYDQKTGKCTDPVTGEAVIFQEAITRGIVDSDSAHVKDTKSGFAKKMTLTRAIEEKFVSPEDGSVHDYETNTIVPLVEAMDKELIVDSRKPVALPRAIHLGLYSEDSGRITDPNTGNKITLHESMRRLVVNPYLPTVFHRHTQTLLSLVEACRAGVIDRQQGMYVREPVNDPEGKQLIPLNEALRSGLIIDSEASYSLYDAIKKGLYVEADGKFVHPASGKKLTLAETIKRGVVDPENSAVVKSSNMKIMKLNDAINEGLVDAALGVYKNPCDGQAILLTEALNNGFILTTRRPVTVIQAVEEKLYSPGRGKLADPVICDWVSISRALKTNLVDPTTTAVQNLKTRRMKSFVAAIDDEDVTSKGTVIDSLTGKFIPLDIAVDKSIIICVDKPVTFREAMAHEYIDPGRGTFFDPRTSVTTPLHEAVSNELIESGSAVVRDPDLDKFRNLREASKIGLIDLKRRALVDPSSKKLKPLCIIFEQGSLIYLRESISFDVARDRNWLDIDTALFSDPSEESKMTLKEAIDINAIDPTSVVVKDTLKKKLFQFPEGYVCAILDPESASVLNTAANNSVSLKSAVENKLVLTPRHVFSLIEALDYSMYNPSSGKFMDPFATKTSPEITLNDSIEKRLIDPHTTVVKVPNKGTVIPLEKAIEEKLIDGVEGWLLDPFTNVRQNLLDAWKNGILVPAEARLAIEAQYRNCDNTITNLMEWLQDVERRLASQESIKETIEELKRQLHTVKNLRDEIEDHSQSVGSCLDQVRDLITRGGDVLSTEEISSLERNGKILKTRYDIVSDQSEKLLRKLMIASDEFKKYKNEVTVFKSWMDKAVKVLEDKERNISNIATSGRDNTKEFVSDVIAHQGDLRFITMSAQKFIDESKDYLQTLNEFRTNLPTRLPFLEARDSHVKQEVTQLTNTYQDLFNRANKLLDKLSNLGNKQKDFQDALNKALNWLKEIQPRVQKVISEPIAGEPKLIEDQLARAKSLQNEVLSNGRIIENVKHASINLLNSMDELSPTERTQVERAANELESKYQNLVDVLKERVSDLDTALVQSQGVQDAVDSVSNWLTTAETNLRSIMKPASLIRERLDEQIREVKLLQADIDSHRPSIESMARSADDLLRSGSSRVSKKVEGKLKDVLSRYEKLVEKLVHRAVFLNEVSTQLESFTYSAQSFEQWFQDMFEVIETKLVGDNAQAILDSVIQQKESRRRDFDETISSGKTLVNKKDVTDTQPCKERIKSLENMWKDLSASLDEKAKLSRQRAEYLNSYEKLRDQVFSWLSGMEGRINNLQPVAVDVDLIKQQTDEVKHMSKDHRDYSSTIDKVNELGAAYDSISRGDRADSPRRRIVTSPTKRSSFRSSEPRSPSPSKNYSAQSPMSPGGSSGFGSRRSSQEGFLNLEDASPVQQQLNEINHRYNLIGMKLSDRQNELDSVRDDVKKITDNLKSLSQFLDKTERMMPKDSVPQTKEESEKILKQIKNIMDDLYDKQGLLDNTRQQIADLLRRKPNVPGGDNLAEDFENINQRWKNLQDTCKKRLGFLDNLKEFHDAHDSLNNWLNAKEKMMSVLGPIATDPRIVQNQMQQVQVIRDEFRAQKPTLDSFNNAGDNILAVTDPNSPDGRKIEDKLANINQKWNDLLHQLDDRQGSLDAASGASQDFFGKLNKLQDNLHKISDDLDDLITEKGDPDEMLKKLNAIEKNLDSQRPVLADVEASGEQLCDILQDPAAKSDIRQKLGQVGRLFNQCQKKLDNAKAELENSKKDIFEFNEDCEAAQDWLNDLLSGFSEKLLVSADRDILKRQVEEFEPTYREVMSKEHEIIMTVNKGKELIAKSPRKADQRALQQNIERIQKGWDKLKKESVDRHTRLQTCLEHCRKYDRSRDAFLTWLTQAEDKFDKFKLVSFKKADIDKQIKELNAFKNDLWRHAGEYDTTRSLGETFLAACDVDKDGVKMELQSLKDRWDALQNAVVRKAQELEDAAAKLSEFNDSVRDVKNALNRCEDKLASHDALGDANKDPKFLQRIKALADEAKKLEKPVENVRQQGEDLCNTAKSQNCDDDHIRNDVDDIMDRYDSLMGKLDDRTLDLEAAQKAMGQFAEQIKLLVSGVNDLENEFSLFKPVGRDIPTVKAQIRELETFADKLQDKRNEAEDAAAKAENLIKQGFASDAKSLRNQIENVRRQIARLEDKTNVRDGELTKTLRKLEGFYDLYGNTDDDINDLISQEKAFSKTIGGDVDAIRAQQSQFKEFKARQVEVVGKKVDECNKTGNELIQTANSGVNTSGLEKDLEKLNDKWNALKQRISEHERKLDGALLQSGKFQEALEGLSKWLSDIEEMVANQKPPAADYKVVKAQLQEQKFLNKMLADRQPAVASLFKMGKEVAANAEPAERAHIEGQMRSLGERYDNLCDGAKDRTRALEDAMQVAREFQDKLGPLQDWLDKTGKKLKDMSLIPTDEDKIQRRIKEHDALHDNILKKQPDFNDLANVASTLMGLVGDEEAATVADKLQDVTDRYGQLVDDSEALRQLLRQAKSDLRHLVLSYEDLVKWMDDMDKRLNKYKVVSVHKDKLLEQMDHLADLTEEIKDHEKRVDDTVDAGLDLMKNISNDEAIQLKDKLDSLQRRFNDITTKAADLLKNAQEALPLVTQFHECHNNLSDWMMDAEGLLQSLDTANMATQEREINRLEAEIPEQRKVLELINLIGPQLCQLSPGEGASTIEGLVTRDNRRFDAICEQIQRRAERIQMAKARSMEVLGDIDDLLDWFREIEGQIKDAEKPSCEPDVVRVQLQEHRALNDEINSQKGRVRDVLATAKKVLREATPGEDTATLREKAEDLKETMESVSKLSSDRLNALEQALPLAEHFFETHNDLNNWMDAMEDEMQILETPAIRPDQIMKLQDRLQAFFDSVNQNKPLVDKLNKTGGALIKLCNDDDAGKVQDIMAADNDRYNSLKAHLREKQQALDKALQETSRFKDKLDGMLNALESTADQVKNAEPISAHPEKIREQIDENAGIIDDMKKREDAYNAVKNTAADVIAKAPNKNDPAVKDIKNKLDRLNSLWDQIQKATKVRGKNLDEALALAEKFWDQLQAVMEKLEALQDTLKTQEPPAVEPQAIQKQQEALKVIKKDIDKTKPEVAQCRQTGQNLMKICGDQDKPEIKKNIEDMDSAWDNITALFAKREENLLDAMEKAMEFHDTLQGLLKFLDRAEERLAGFGVIGTDIDAVKRQIKELKDFKSDVDPMMVKVESLNRQAQELTERTSPDQAAKIKGPLAKVNRRWDDLLKGIVDRQRELENALLRLGQFQHALQELMAWIEKTNKSLDTLKPVYGDPQVIEVELAKLKVLMNDIQAHQNSVDTLNDAGRQIIEAEKGSDNASSTQRKLNDLNTKWELLQSKANGKHKELEDALREAQLFNQEIQDLLLWLNEVDAAISSSKPTGGLPETAAEQLARFMEIYNELEANRPKVEAVLHQGQEYLKKSTEGSATNLQHNLRTLRQRWESVMNRANDKKIKLEIALKEANEFHKAVQDFIDWLTEAESYLSRMEPVSRVLPKVVEQIETHKEFQKEVSSHREVMLSLDKKGNHLKYFSQKQDVILIKNLLISVQHRWDRVVSKSNERTRALDLGLKESKEFHDAWTSLCKWLDEAEASLDEMATTAGNNPIKIKQMLAKHKEFQKALSAKQPFYDNTMKMGKALKDKAPKSDEPVLRQMLTDLKNKWNSVCNKSVERQRNLEEALLRSGQFKDALQELLDWLKSIDNLIVDDGPVHGDLDTVMALIEKHKKVEDELHNRRRQLDDVVRTAEELMETASPEEREKLREHVREVKSLFDKIKTKCDTRSRRLEQALKEAEKLHKAVHMLLEWLSDAEMKLRFSGSLPEDEEATRKMLEEQEQFMRELLIKEREKDDTIDLAKSILAKAHPDAINVIKHWISIIQSRWDEISSWAKQRGEKLKAHLASLRDLEDLLEELMSWLQRCEDTLVQLEAEPLPDDMGEIQVLIKDHKEFMEGMAKRQPEIDSVCKPKLITRQPAGKGKPGSRLRSVTPGSESRETSPEIDFAHRRISPGREKTPDLFPHIGPRFDRRGSKAIEPQIKNPRVKALWDKWKHVWMMAWERQRRLQDKYNYLLELEKVKHFSWEDWRKRFLKFMNHKKSRVTDLFRKIDKNNDRLIPREDFIDAIMKTKFPTSRLEMNAVADMFDHGDHLIDYMEFIAALRPDWEEKKPVKDNDIVDDEIQRQVMQCTCRQKFRVFQVGEGKYRFGDSQKLRLVRILRSTVMVRVGGGWVALDEFLVKNDPCRAKGRTNIELREQFILADGVSQTMTAFKSKASGGSSGRQSTPLSNAGPIIKVKEKSMRSVPMGRARSTDRTTPESTFSDDGFSYSRLPRKSGTTAGRGSTPGSRSGSKPPSRAGSNASLDSSVDEYSSRIPIRRSGSLKRGSPGSGLRTPLGSSTPVSRPPFSLNTNANGGSSRGRSPSAGGTERALSFTRPSSAQSAARKMQRTGSASSLSSMTNFGIRSRTPSNSNIPVAISSHTTPSRARTPSGSNVTFSPGAEGQTSSSSRYTFAKDDGAE